MIEVEQNTETNINQKIETEQQLGEPLEDSPNREQKNSSQMEEKDQNFGKQKKSNDFATVFGVVKCMIGGILLTLPNNVLYSGLLVCFVVMLPLAVISWKTASWIILHSILGEIDMSMPIYRISGPAWYFVFIVSSVMGSIFGVAIYFGLLIQTFYALIASILTWSGVTNYSQNITMMVWNQWSIQWLSVIMFLIFIPILMIREIKKMVFFGIIGFITISVYMIFILYVFIDNFVNGNIYNNYG